LILEGLGWALARLGLGVYWADDDDDYDLLAIGRGNWISAIGSLEVTSLADWIVVLVADLAGGSNLGISALVAARTAFTGSLDPLEFRAIGFGT
jgi:hypothetical protein